MAIKLPINMVITGLTPLTLAISTNIGGSNNSILKLNIKSNDVNISLASFKFNISLLAGDALNPNIVNTIRG